MNNNEIEILLLEDNVSDAELTIRALRTQHVTNKLIHFDNGLDAMHFLLGTGPYADRNTSIQPKLVLLDLNMPNMSGLEVLAAIRSSDITRKIPVVILTVSHEDPDIRKCYQLGANSYIVKPLEFDSFTRAVAEVGLYWLALNKPPL